MMSGTNPLEVLGIPKALVARERDQGQLSKISVLAKGYYKELIKQYHPDKGGDDDLMALFTDALDDLTANPEDIEFYADELLGVGSVERKRTQSSTARMRKLHEQSFDALASGLRFTNQFELLGIDRATSYKLRVGGSSVIIEVLSPSETKVMLSVVPEDTPLSHDPGASADAELSYRNGFWQEVYVADDTPGVFVHDKLTVVSNARIVGSFTDKFVRQAPSEQQSSMFGNLSLLSSSSPTVSLDWIKPQQAWFLAGLQQLVEVGDTVVLCSANGTIAQAGILDRLSAME